MSTILANAKNRDLQQTAEPAKNIKVSGSLSDIQPTCVLYRPAVSVVGANNYAFAGPASVEFRLVLSHFS
jgi:hypothetical protein